MAPKRQSISSVYPAPERFTKHNSQHPTYKALCELGKALKTTFLCDYYRCAANSGRVTGHRKLEQCQ
jgi:TnpA family transposase